LIHATTAERTVERKTPREVLDLPRLAALAVIGLAFVLYPAPLDEVSTALGVGHLLTGVALAAYFATIAVLATLWVALRSVLIWRDAMTAGVARRR